ncbi:PEPxxWA-CTERM sorting domain-containing protein [Phenylobacterium sp.]|uniref:PEPxxWA-CTERM sorting domain-containing protein n=1 Tax=Phenylobacterium sp. TaxID=1871053 RepID=UPI0025CD239D|nr:PEPxxWA-CTERM sorting domain-containing protein [Phenylobacterium sp.]
MSARPSLRVLCASAACAAGIFAAAVPASAAVMVATYTGVISSGSDTDDLFGLGGNLSGATFSASFTYDTSIFDFHTTMDDGSSHYDRISGYSENTPIIAASVTINGVTDVFRLDGVTYDFARQQYNHTPTYDYSMSQVAGYDYDPVTSGYSFYEYAYVDFYSAAETPTSLTGAFDSGPSAAASQAQFLNYDAFNPDKGGYDNYYAFVGAPTHLTVSAVDAGAVPEPGAWALMIVGFAGLGATLRRRGVACGLA